MKKTIVVSMMLTLTLVLISSVQARAQNILIPEINLGEVKVKLYGFSQIVHDDESDDWDIGNVRLRTKVDYRSWGFFGEVNFAHSQRKDINWLRRAYLIYHFNDDWEIRAGRLFLSAGTTTPPPFLLETVMYPIGDFFNNYAWGIQMVGEWGDGWSFSADVSGDSGKTFESQDNFNGLDASARIKKKIGKFILSNTIQLSQDYQRLGAEVTWQPQKSYHLRAAICGEKADTQKSESRIGAYLISAWRPVSFFEIHNQVDFRKYTSGNGNKDVVATNGVRIFAGKKDIISVTADYQTVVSGRRNDCFLLRVQLMF